MHSAYKGFEFCGEMARRCQGRTVRQFQSCDLNAQMHFMYFILQEKALQASELDIINYNRHYLNISIAVWQMLWIFYYLQYLWAENFSGWWESSSSSTSSSIVMRQFNSRALACISLKLSDHKYIFSQKSHYVCGRGFCCAFCTLFSRSL